MQTWVAKCRITLLSRLLPLQVYLLLMLLPSSLKIYISLWSYFLTKADLEFYYLSISYDTRYIPSVLRILPLRHIVNHSPYSLFQYLCFHQVIINDQDFLVAFAFCLVSSPSTVRSICFSLTGLVSVRKNTLHNDLRKIAVGTSSNGTKFSAKFTKKPSS